jgi:putative ABC transport system permease protein
MVFTRLRALVRGERLDRELNAEVRFHIDMETDKYVRQGMNPDDARMRALRNFGPMDKHKEETRDARGVRWIDELWQDVKYGTRTLLNHPGFALLVVLTLGLGIGANTAIFSVINGVLLKPLPYAESDRLVLIQQAAPGNGQPTLGVSIKELYDYREQLESFDGIVEFHQMNFDLLNRGEPDRVNTGVVSANFFDVLGIKPALGRTFADKDDDEGAEAVLVLSHSYWRSKFGSDPNIVGQVFEMNDRPHRVIGVLPQVPHYPQESDVYMPTSACPFRSAAERTIARNRRAFPSLVVFGRLQPGAPRELAATEVATVAERFRRDYPEVYREGSGFRAAAPPVLQELTRNARPMLLILLGTTGLVLLIACANVANLTLARMLRRDRELALRTALGAGRGRLVRQLLTESTLVAIVGGALGLAFALATADLLTTFVGRFTARTGEVGIDPAVLGFTLLVSVATGLLFGTLPAFTARVDVVGALKQGSLQAGDASARRRLQGALIVAQVAVSVMLLAAAGLLLVSFYRLQRVDAGYRADRVLSAEVFGNFSRYGNPNELRRLYLPLLERIENTPGVVLAAITNGVPLAGVPPGNVRFDIEGRVSDDPDRRPGTDVRVASPKYFETLGIPLLRGRAFTDLDRQDAAPVVIINQSMTRYWDNTDPIGSRLSTDRGETWYTVVGIVGDVKQFGLDRAAIAQTYIPLAQTPQNLAGRLLVRTTGDPLAMGQTVRDAVHAIDPNQPVENVRTLEDLRDTFLATPRLTATLLGLFAVLALVVTLAGIAGVIATSVSQRTREFGVRMALGASRDTVLAMVLRQGLTMVGLGLVLGIAGAIAAGRVLSSYLYETAPTDPIILGAVGLAFLLAGTLACLGPARRATTVDPLIALRAE